MILVRETVAPRTKRRRKRRSNRVFHRAVSLLRKTALLFAGLSILAVVALRWLDPPASSFMLQHRIRSTWAGGEDYRYNWVEWEGIAAEASLAVVAAEDQLFPRHFGFDFSAIRQALRDYQASARLRGASTISQQVVKNLFLWPERSLLRKSLEAYLTVLLELIWPKRRILEVYLNVAQFGDSTFGIGAASRAYFGKSPAALEPRECALLAVVLPNPTRYKVENPSSYARARRDWILRQMKQLGGVAYLKDL